MSASLIQEYFKEILDNYVAGREKYDTVDKVPHIHALLAGVNGKLPLAIGEEANLPNNFKVRGSIGQANITHTPWLGVFDESITTSAQTSYYIVYLFQKDMSGVYLSLNQGWMQYDKRYRPRSKAIG